MIHEPFHRFPVFINNRIVSELFPDHPRDDDSGIRPTDPHHFCRGRTILPVRSNARIASEFRLGVAYIACPFVEESVGVGEERACLRKNLRVCGPSETLVSLRAVGGDGKVVRTLSPDSVGNQLVDKGVTGCERARFKFFCD